MNALQNYRNKLRHKYYGLYFVLLLLVSLIFTTSSVSAETLIPITVQKGSNLIQITRQFCTSEYHWKEIAKINKLSPPYIISPGHVIYAPVELLKVEKLSAKVASVIGGVFLVHNGNKLKRIAKGDLIFPGQTIVTEEDGYAHLVFPDNKYTRISSVTKFSMTYLVRLVDNSFKAEFFLEKGRISHTVKKQLKTNETFNTRTPVSVTGVRGTKFRMKVSDAGENIVETMKGVVNVGGDGRFINVNKGEGTKVVAGLPPAPPQKLPEIPPVLTVADIFRVLPVKFIAPVEKNIVAYRLRISTDEEGNDTLIEQVAGAGETFILLALQDGKYFGHLTAIDQDNFESIPADPFRFEVRTRPAAPLFTEPRNGKVLFDKNISVEWLQGDEVNRYHVQLAEDEAFEHVKEDFETENNFFQFKDLAPGKYYFHVQAIADDGFRSLFSLQDSWEIKKEMSLGSLDGSSDKGLKLRWESMGEGIVYDLQVSRNSSFTDMLLSKNGLKDPELISGDYVEPDTYYVRVRGVLGDGQVSPWSPVQKLRIKQPPFGLYDSCVLAFFLGLILL